MKDFTFIDRCYLEWLISSCNDDLVEDESVAIYEDDENTQGEILKHDHI